MTPGNFGGDLVDRPTFAIGKICYIEMPAADIDRSAEFYQTVFGWHIRQRGDGTTAFDDGVSEVSGTWVQGRAPASEPGLLIYIMVADADTAVETVIDAGGEFVQSIYPGGREVFATFRDPAGNVLAIYEQPGLAAAGAGS
jgi:predicted enzyme related to lactoylglutathione lyase